MTWWQAVILGIVQGLTEFLPVSSSAHLVLVPHLFGWELAEDGLFAFDVLVQAASLAAVIAYFWKDLLEIGVGWASAVIGRRPADPRARMGWLLILASIPAGLLGLLLKDTVEAAFGNPIQTAVSLLITAGLLAAAERFGKRQRSIEQLGAADALWIGLGQAAAIFPGISRSGATISAGMSRALERPAATRFAFLMTVPVMAAAGALGGLDLLALPDLASRLPVIIPGIIASALVSYVSIRWLLGYLVRHTLYGFAVYCVGFAGLALVVLALR